VETPDNTVNLVLYLLQKIIFNDPTKNCIIKGKKADWKGLPQAKSLFYAGNNKGFPIGNLTSQLFGNIYLNDFDHYIKYKLGIKYYGRYVDDFVIVHPNKEYLKSIIPLLSDYLQSHLSLKLHPKKIYLQHYTKGVKFLGVVLKPYRIYIGNQTKGTFYKKIQFWNNYIKENNCKMNNDPSTLVPRYGTGDLKLFLSSMNSYLGVIYPVRDYDIKQI